MLIITFVNFQFSQLRDLCPLGMSMGGDGVRRASLERRASLLKSMEPTITIGFAEVAWEKRKIIKAHFPKTWLWERRTRGLVRFRAAP